MNLFIALVNWPIDELEFPDGGQKLPYLRMLTDFHRRKYHFPDKNPCVEIVNVLFRIINYIWFILTRFKKWKYQIFIRDFLMCLVTVKSGQQDTLWDT